MSPPTGTARVRKCVLLPRRSLLVISGEARYHWSHGIAPRKQDQVMGQLVPRGRRVSLTFRHVLRPGPIPADRLASGEMEAEHVVKVYDAIALHWHHTRGKRKVHWHRVKDFLESLPQGAVVGDVGSGDGKYFGLRPDLITIGCDRSQELLRVSHETSHETFVCDAVSLPLRSDAFDAVLCIAVLHHIASVDRRCALIRELLRVAKEGASVFIQAWALEQDSRSKHVFNSQDTMVPWKLNKRFQHPQPSTSVASSSGCSAAAVDGDVGATVMTNPAAAPDQDDIVVYERYCHVYREGELEELCSQVAGCEVVDRGWDRGNWFVQLRKVRDNRLEHAALGPEAPLPFRPLHKL